MKWMKKIAPLAAALVLLVVLGFVTRHQNQMPCKGVEIRISSSAGMYFLDRDDVYHQLVNAADSVEGRPMISIDTRHIEDAIASMPEVKKADVFKTIDGQLRVHVDLRVPVARVLHPNGTSFYIDEDGEMMPLSPRYMARVLLVNGHIKQGAINTYTEFPVADEWENQRRELFELASFIRSDFFWSAQIQQVYVDENIEYVLIPRVGNHEIHFGDLSDVETKFTSLKALYEQVLSKSDWNQYRLINLKYKNQIVCSKK